MSLAATVELDDRVTPYLARASAALADAQGLNRAIAEEAARETAGYIRGLQGKANKHTWARALGVKDSNYWTEASERVIHGADADAAYIGVDQVGYRRAIEDVTIVPGPGKKNLAIPVHPDARGVYPRELPEDFLTYIPGSSLPGGKPLLARDMGEERLEVWYVLTPRVRQRRDEQMLPNAELLGQAAANGFLAHLIAHGLDT